MAGSAAWADVCQRLCDGLEVPLTVRDVTVDRDHPAGLEAAAREVRRAALSVPGADWLALAHHRDDQAETVLFRAIRGAGVRGAAGMREVVAGAPGLWRPLIDVPRRDLLQWAEAHGLVWIEDPSNADAGFSRNFLRHAVLPVIAERFPGASASLARLGRLSGEAADLLDEMALADGVALARAEAGCFDLPGAWTLSSARLRNLLRHRLALAGEAMPDEDRLRDLERQFRSGSAAAGLRLVIGGVALCTYRDRWWLESAELLRAPDRLVWQAEPQRPWAGGEVEFTSAVGVGLDARQLAGAHCELRRRVGGERLRLGAGRPARTLKNLLQEAAVPPWRRADLPLLWLGDRLAWVANLGVAAEFACPPGQAGVLPCWYPAGVAR